MDLSSTGDEYSRRGDEALNGILNMQKVVDDILMYDESIENHYEYVRQLLNRCRLRGITLNPNKFNFSQEDNDFVGYKIDRSKVFIGSEKDRGFQ